MREVQSDGTGRDPTAIGPFRFGGFDTNKPPPPNAASHIDGDESSDRLIGVVGSGRFGV